MAACTEYSIWIDGYTRGQKIYLNKTIALFTAGTAYMEVLQIRDFFERMKFSNCLRNGERLFSFVFAID